MLARRAVVLLSGRGSNLQALIERAASYPSYPRLVAAISNRPDAGGLAIARRHGLHSVTVDHHRFPGRAGFERALAEAVDAWRPDLVVLAGFMRVLGAGFVRRYHGRMINIHPSLLPAYRGLDTHARALAAGETEHGASVHFVSAELDGGPLIAQARVAVLANDDAERLAARVLSAEHRLYPQVLAWFAAGRLALADKQQVLFDGAPLGAALQV